MDADVLVATAHPEVHAAALRWCAAAGVTVHESHTLDATRRMWRTAPLVLLGEDLADAVARDPGCPRRGHVHLVAEQADLWWRHAVEVGAHDVFGTADDQRAVRGLGGVIDHRHEGCSVVVMGAGGGVGCSTFSVALGLEAARRHLDPVLLDADPCGPGLELIAGSERADGMRWTSLVDAGGRVAPGSLAGALPTHRGVSTVGWDPHHERPELPEAALDVWSAAVRAFDLVVVDQPGIGRHELWESAILGGSVLTVVLVPDDISGVGAGRRVLSHIESRAASVAVVAVRRRGGLGGHAVEDALGVPVISAMKRDLRVRSAVDHGRGPGRSRALRRPAREVLDLIGLDAHRGDAS